MTSTVTDPAALLKVRRGAVEIVDVPEFGYLMVDGAGPPDGPEFAAAVRALYAASYGLHFAVKKRFGAAPKVMPLEALWWIDDPEQQDILAAVALGRATMADTDRGRWQWRAMIAQPEAEPELIAGCLADVRAKKDLPALDRLRYERWAEGRCAQVLHVGPYAEEAASIVRLHEGIAAAGYRPYGRHHEIYLGDPRRSPPEKLRTILRHPVRDARLTGGAALTRG